MAYNGACILIRIPNLISHYLTLRWRLGVRQFGREKMLREVHFFNGDIEWSHSGSLTLVSLLSHSCWSLVLAEQYAKAKNAYTWDGTASGVWTDQNNWKPSEVPEDGDSVILNGIISLARHRMISAYHA